MSKYGNVVTKQPESSNERVIIPVTAEWAAAHNPKVTNDYTKMANGGMGAKLDKGTLGVKGPGR